MDQPIEEQINQLATQSKVQLIVSQEQYGEDEVSLAEIFGNLMKGKNIIILITLIAFTLSTLGAGVNAFVMQEEVGKVDTIISLNFGGIEAGLNPDGDPFNINEVMSKVVLENTVRQLGLAQKGISSDTLRENMQIQGIVPASIQSQIALINQMAEKDVSQLQRIQDIKYYSTQYKITLDITKDMELTREESEQVLSTIINNYKSYFMDTYNDKKLLSTAITTMDASRYDYSEYMLMVDNVLKDMETFLQEQNQIAPDYRAKSTGLSFNELSKQVEMLRNIELNNTQAIINTFMLTKNKERLTSIYENNIKNLEIEMQQQLKLAESIRSAASEYKKDKLVVMGQEDTTGNVEVSKSSEMYDQLIEEALLAEQRATQIQYNKEYHQNLLDKLTVETGSTPQVDVAPYIQQVEESILYIQEQMNSLVTSINTTVEEYYNVEVFKNSVKSDTPAMYQSFMMTNLKSNALVVVIGTLLGGILAVLYVLMKGFVVKDEEDKIKGGRHEA